jgi:iron complex outermembrane receptor protein
VVTGSRIRRDTFTSTSPLQVINEDTIAESGVLDVGELLRTTTVVQGAQLDQTVNSNFVTSAGPGGAAVSLRGLEPERTLVLVNGRRYAPAGVEGAPSFPDISLIPSTMIQRVDILLDGASSVYGADAVAGVVNVVLRDEYEGFNVDLFQNFTDGGGQESQISVLMGDVGERSSFLFGMEYRSSEELLGNERDWMYTGTRYGPIDIVEDENQPGSNNSSVIEGNSHAQQAFGAWVAGSGCGICAFVIDPTGQSTYDAEGNLTGQLPGFMTWDFTGDPLYVTTITRNQDQWLTPSVESATAYMRGEYDISDTIPGTSAFLELNLSNRQTFFNFGDTLMDVTLPPDNAYNPWGVWGSNEFPTDSITTRPLQPWQDILDVELTQYRAYGGLDGDLEVLGLADWDYELFAGYTRSQGHSRRTGVRENALFQSIHHVVDPMTNEVSCAPAINFDDQGDFQGTPSPEPCVPFNPVDTGLWVTDGGPITYSTGGLTAQDITDYLRGVRDVTTFVDETTFGGFATGPLFTLPAGAVQGVVGAEWRETAIDTYADDTAARGLLDGFFSDAPTIGSVESYDVFGELSIPILSGHELAEELTVELNGRFVNNEFYGENTVYAAKVNYRPVDWLTLRGTYGTSFRAPNLRELFLAGQTFFASDPDPCRVPALAQNDLDMDNQFDYDASGDSRSATTIANCQAEGLDPFSLGLGVFGGSVEGANAGNTGLDPEESDTYTAGFVIEQPWFSAFDARIGLTYWDIAIEGAVANPTTAQTALSCYTSANFPNDPYCQRLGPRDPNTNFLTTVDVTPFNLAEETASGFDFNAFVGTDFSAVGKDFRAELDFVSTRTDEIANTVTILGVTTNNEFAGELGNPEWRGTANARLLFDNWTLFWQTRYIGDQTTDVADRPSNCYDGASLDVERCYTVPSVIYHDLSVNYEMDTWTFRVGANNVFDQDPPRIDEDVSFVNTNGVAGLNARSVPIGLGYDNVGRTIFARVSKAF